MRMRLICSVVGMAVVLGGGHIVQAQVLSGGRPKRHASTAARLVRRQPILRDLGRAWGYS